MELEKCPPNLAVYIYCGQCLQALELFPGRKTTEAEFIVAPCTNGCNRVDFEKDVKKYEEEKIRRVKEPAPYCPMFGDHLIDGR